MKKWLNLNEKTPWYTPKYDEKSSPVYRYADSPSHWEATGRVIMNCYGEGQAIDIRIMETATDKQHQVNITVGDDGKLKARVSEQMK